MTDDKPLGKLDPERPTSRDHQRDVQSILEEDSKSLEATRESAEKWRTGLAGLWGLIAAAVLIKGKESIDEIAWPWDLVIGIVIVLTILLLVVSTFKALHAAAGQPSQVPTAEINRVGGIDAYKQKLAKESSDSLKAAKELAVGAIVLFVAAVLISFWAPSPDPEPLAKLQVRASGEELCGTSRGVRATNLLLATSGGTEPIPLEEIQAFALVAECP